MFTSTKHAWIIEEELDNLCVISNKYLEQISPGIQKALPCWFLNTCFCSNPKF